MRWNALTICLAVSVFSISSVKADEAEELIIGAMKSDCAKAVDYNSMAACVISMKRYGIFVDWKTRIRSEILGFDFERLGSYSCDNTLAGHAKQWNLLSNEFKISLPQNIVNNCEDITKVLDSVYEQDTARCPVDFDSVEKRKRCFKSYIDRSWIVEAQQNYYRKLISVGGKEIYRDPKVVSHFSYRYETPEGRMIPVEDGKKFTQGQLKRCKNSSDEIVRLSNYSDSQFIKGYKSPDRARFPEMTCEEFARLAVEVQLASPKEVAGILPRSCATASDMEPPAPREVRDAVKPLLEAEFCNAKILKYASQYGSASVFNMKNKMCVRSALGMDLTSTDFTFNNDTCRDQKTYYECVGETVHRCDSTDSSRRGIDCINLNFIAPSTVRLTYDQRRCEWFAHNLSVDLEHSKIFRPK